MLCTQVIHAHACGQFADPMDMDAQRRIAELIEQSNINENYENAMEHTPESFGRVQMLYVDMEVNGVPLKVLCPLQA